MLAWLLTIYRHTSSRTWGVIRERGITLRLVKSIKRCGPSYISFEHNLKVMWLMTYIQLAQMMFALIITPKIRVVSSFVIFFIPFLRLQLLPDFALLVSQGKVRHQPLQLALQLYVPLLDRQLFLQIMLLVYHMD